MTVSERPGTGPLRTAYELILIAFGALLNALAIDIFLMPNDVVAGGVTGLAVIGELSLGVPFGVGLVLLNLPLVALQWRLLGGMAAVARTTLGVVLLAVFTDALAPYLPQATDDRLLVICYGGGLAGLGLAMVFQGRGTTGGADILARLVNRWFGWSFGRTFLVINASVYGLAAVLYGLEPAMVALLVAFVLGRTLDAVLHGLTSSRAVLVVTERADEVRRNVVELLGRGLTMLSGTGGYSGRDKTVLYAVVPRADIQRLKRHIRRHDPDAFITVLTPREAVGGFHAVRSG